MEYFITSAGIPVHINESKKDGRAILLLHGYLETLYIWNEFQELIPSEYRVVSIDLPGHGLSGIPVNDFTPDFSSSFFSCLLDKLSIKACHFVTHSCGYHMISAFSVKYPERVLSIVNVGSPLFPTFQEESFIDSVLKSVKEGFFLKFVSQFIPKMYHCSNLRACDEKIEETIQICETHDPESVLAFFTGISSFFPQNSGHSAVNVSSLNIAGESSVFFNEVPEGFIIIPETGLNSFIEKPAEVFDRLSSFLFDR